MRMALIGAITESNHANGDPVLAFKTGWEYLMSKTYPRRVNYSIVLISAIKRKLDNVYVYTDKLVAEFDNFNDEDFLK